MHFDAVFTGGRIRTMDPERPEAHAIGIIDGRIRALDDDVTRLPARQTFDLGGAPVVPAFNDVHHHLSMRGQRLNGVDLRASAIGSMDELYDAVSAAAREAQPGEWIYGSGYDQNKLSDAHPLAAELDRRAPDNPVWLEHVSGHMGVANSRAFAIAGYAELTDVPDVDGGHVARTDDGRTAAGLVEERAMDLITRVYKPLPVDDIVRNIRTASEQALREGIGSITEPGIGTIAGIGNSPLDLHAYLTAAETGALGVRATVMPYLTTLHRIVGRGDATGEGLDLGLRTGMGDEWLRIGPVKVLTDGSLIGRSAAMTCCYHGEESSGYMAWDVDELTELLRGAYRLGFRLATHAIGDAAVDHALDIIEGAQRDFPRTDPRNRIEHFGVASDEQIARAARLGVIGVPQPRFITELGDGMARALGPERTPLCYRVRSLIDAGIRVPGSSDAPVVDGSPILGIHDFVNRRTASGAEFGPAETITAEQALRAYTVDSAYASHEDTLKGDLSIGKLADFTVLSDDLLQVPAEALRGVQVGATVVGGEIRYDDGAIRS